MIDGEIYTIGNETIFAYRGENSSYFLHYICVFNNGVVKRYGDGWSTGNLGKIGDIRPATNREVERFKLILRRYDYHYNKLNKKVTGISTGRLL